MHKCILGFKVTRSPLRLSLQVFCTKLFSVLESIGSCWLAAQHSNGCSNLQLVNVYIWCTININDYGTVLDSLLTEMSIFRFLPYSTLFSFYLFLCSSLLLLLLFFLFLFFCCCYLLFFSSSDWSHFLQQFQFNIQMFKYTVKNGHQAKWILRSRFSFKLLLFFNSQNCIIS